MSWEVWSFIVLGAVVLGGFAWYERSRPPSQVVALVAALAALAVAGRLAFAAIPNVVATTDIVVFAGYAIGPAPGFAVGALAGLVSNFWLGQGPWTPWQMAAWGLCGVFGALLARRGMRLGRVSLAVACGFAGVAFGALMNFSLMATYGGELSLERFAVLETRAIPFDAAHAIGNVTLALIAGPAMVRMLSRFRERFEWRLAGSTAAAGLALLTLGAASTTPAQGPAGRCSGSRRRGATHSI
jgi:energy-coupling factor transport system substrate-specific component